MGQPEQRLLNRLSVFRGGWDLKAAEAVGAGDDNLGENVLDYLSALVEQSLVVTETDAGAATRYRLLVPVREYAEERLEQSDAAVETQERHGKYFLRLAERAETELLGPRQAEWLRRLETENDNLRAALTRALDRRGAHTALRLAAALRRFWEVRGLFNEGRGWLDVALATGEGVDSPARAKALDGAGWISMWQGDLEQALPRFEEAVALSRRLAEGTVLANSLHGIGSVLGSRADARGAVPFLEEGVAAARDAGDAHTLAYSLGSLASIVTELGDYERAQELLEESLEILRQLGDKLGIGRSLHVLAVGALDRRDYRRMQSAAAEMLLAFRDVGYSIAIAFSLELIAASAAVQSQSERAVRLWSAADALRDAIGAPRQAYSLRFEPHLECARAQLDEESYERALSEGGAMTVEQAIAFALDHDNQSP